LLGSRSSRRLGGKGFLSRSSEAAGTGRRPRNHLASQCRDSNDGVVETCLNMNHPLGVFRFDFFAICLAIRVTLFFLCAVLAITKGGSLKCSVFLSPFTLEGADHIDKSPILSLH
jgi:hypothetical protein